MKQETHTFLGGGGGGGGAYRDIEDVHEEV